MNQAAIRSSALGHDDITMLELEWAKDKIMMGKLWVQLIGDCSLPVNLLHHLIGGLFWVQFEH